jgi:hypothetical protein
MCISVAKFVMTRLKSFMLSLKFQNFMNGINLFFGNFLMFHVLRMDPYTANMILETHLKFSAFYIVFTLNHNYKYAKGTILISSKIVLTVLNWYMVQNIPIHPNHPTCSKYA